ncbi:CPBP family intramembrane glutamic endopeptidase [Nocardia sp. NPDC049707]|uniref:CPBP family intramembrane glutamic endopeptidase n=1 Tax=Nocardia sp. NPDC049707 TaxID=3154735 RepID=UPI00342ABD49
MIEVQGQRRRAVANPVGVGAFLVIAFGATWLWYSVAIVVLGLSIVNPVVQLPMGVAPAVAAMVVRRWITREGFGDAGLAVRFRESWRWYLGAWLGPVGLAAAAVGLALIIGLWRSDGGLSVVRTVPILLVMVVVLVPVYWGEEFGWTSYLRPRLFPDRPRRSVLTTGLIWAVWHYPLALLGYINFSNVVLGLAIWTISFIAQETILAWLYLRSRSVWTASLAHAGNNMVLSFLAGELLAAQLGDTVLTAVVAVPLGVVAAWIMLTGRLDRAATAASYVPRPRVTPLSHQPHLLGP